VEGYRIRHGEAVAVGMMYAAEVSRLAGRLAAEAVGRHRAVLSAVGLPVTCRSGPWPALREAMAFDKKARGARLRLIILERAGHPVPLEDPPEDLLAQAYAEVVAR
jgi:3-dehydroquinate synthase